LPWVSHLKVRPFGFSYVTGQINLNQLIDCVPHRFDVGHHRSEKGDFDLKNGFLDDYNQSGVDLRPTGREIFYDEIASIICD
jgi:hypothetical protein